MGGVRYEPRNENADRCRSPLVFRYGEFVHPHYPLEERAFPDAHSFRRGVLPVGCEDWVYESPDEYDFLVSFLVRQSMARSSVSSNDSS